MQAINPNRGLADFDTVDLDEAAAAFANQTSGRLKDVATQKINDINVAKTTEETSLLLIQENIYPTYTSLIGVSVAIPVDDLSGNNSCLDRLLSSAQDADGFAVIRAEIVDHVAKLGEINGTEARIIADLARAVTLLANLNSWYSELTASTSPPPTRLEEISSGLNGNAFPSPADATAEYNDLVSKRDNAQAALTKCQS